MRTNTTDNAEQSNTEQSDSTLKLCDHAQYSDRYCASDLVFCRVLVCFLTAFVLLFFIGIIQVQAAEEPPTSQIDTATTQRSEKGLYDVSFKSVGGPIVINTIHEWRLSVVSTDGLPVDGLTITIDGGMPTHDHGLPTAPRVTESLGAGQYRVEGFKFQMPGHWTTTFNLTDNDEVSDSVTFNLVL